MPFRSQFSRTPETENIEPEMPEWIHKAANVFRREVPVEPQPFEVVCECGQHHQGVRKVRHQHIVCKTCGASLFVLPNNRYPPPHTPQKSNKKKRSSRRSARSTGPLDLSPDPVIVREVDGDAEAPTHRRSKATPPEAAPQPRPIVDRGPNAIVLAWRRLVDACIGMVLAFWDFWKPSRLIGLVIVTLLGLTIWYSVRQSRLRDALATVKADLEAGQEAISQNDWVRARTHFEAARESVDLLGRQDLEANLIRQYHRETAVLTSLSSTPLFELVEEAEAFYVQHGAEKWQTRFDLKYRGQWSIIEGFVRPTTNPQAVADGYRFELIFPVEVGNRRRPVEVQVDFRTAPHLPAPANDGVYDTGDGVLTVFGGQLAECFIGPRGRWIVRYDPETSFFWTNRETYEATHLHIGSIQPLEVQQQMFARQAKWMGVKE